MLNNKAYTKWQNMTSDVMTRDIWKDVITCDVGDDATKMWGWCNDDVCCNVKNDVTWRTKGAVITVCAWEPWTPMDNFGWRGAASILLCMSPSSNGFKQTSWDFWLLQRLPFLGIVWPGRKSYCSSHPGCLGYVRGSKTWQPKPDSDRGCVENFLNALATCEASLDDSKRSDHAGNKLTE